jgi:hypothetical protein
MLTLCGHENHGERPQGPALVWAASTTLIGVLAWAQPSAPLPLPRETPRSDSAAGMANGKAGRSQSILASRPQNAESQTSKCQARIPRKRVQRSGHPDAPSAYVPLSPECKFELFLRQTYSPYTFSAAGFEATWAQMWAQWPDYGGGMQGWGKRFGATLADTESRRFVQGFLLSTLLHEDPRYFPSDRKRLLGRALSAATRVLITRSDAGRSEFNSSELLGTLAVSSLQNAYYPAPSRTFGGTMSRFAEALGSDATSYVLDEFTPDLKRLFRKHAPQKVKEIEKKIPIPDEYKP